MTCLNSAKWLMTCSKLAKWLLYFLTCSKSVVLNKAIQGVFLSLKKVNLNSKDTYLLEKSSGK